MPAEYHPAARKLRAEILFLFSYSATETNSKPFLASLIKDSNAAFEIGVGFT